MRKINFQNGNYYHIFNRGVDKRDIFLDDKDFVRFIVSMREFNQIEPVGSIYNVLKQKKTSDVSKRRRMSSLVNFIAYCLNKNYYHFLLLQDVENGVSDFMKRIGDGYIKYFNYKNNRLGSLFQDRFKAVPVKSIHKLIKLSCYINGNPEIHKICKVKDWKWSSYQDYLDLRRGTMSDKNLILKEFENIQEYKELTGVVIGDSVELKEYILE